VQNGEQYHTLMYIQEKSPKKAHRFFAQLKEPLNSTDYKPLVMQLQTSEEFRRIWTEPQNEDKH
jgi:hypothetical protein